MDGPMILTALFALVLAVAMLWDIATFEIPDTLSVMLVLLAAAGLLTGGGPDYSPLALLGSHVTAALAAFAGAFVLFAIGLWGGGDVKFLGAVSLWFGWSGLPAYLLTVAIAGGAFTALLLVFRAVALPAGLARIAWAERLHRRDQGVPYGVALGLGGLVQIDRAVAAVVG
ncbi:A24 family peptidase [Azospirillum sp.]|uniref:A24 family peptidase n=1 Tax=Azospirillum sp. TaxID=34012 RepID=UPI002D332639|nr:prepilin peptidase [Azospirillum sp.]HYD69886.1 prepilin peptidase [Azospirillum sp.]